CLLRNEVIHHAQEASGQEKPYRVMAIPPLHHGISSTCVDRVRFSQGHRDCQVIHYVQYRGGNNKSTVEPVSYVDVRGFTLYDGTEEYRRIRNPHQRQQNIDWPL